MIGIIAALLAGIVLKQWVFGLAVIPYLLRFRSRNLSIVAFYAYLLSVTLTIPSVSVYTHSGLVAAVVTFSSTFLLLDEVLRGIAINRDRLILSGLLLISAVHDYAFILVLVGVTLYVAYIHFGRAAHYLAGWMAFSTATLYALRNRLQDPVAQSFVVIGLGLLFLLLAERNDVDFLEVGLFEEE